MGNKDKKLNIYLDNCCYSRPYDDQSHLLSLEECAEFADDIITRKAA